MSLIIIGDTNQLTELQYKFQLKSISKKVQKFSYKKYSQISFTTLLSDINNVELCG